MYHSNKVIFFFFVYIAHSYKTVLEIESEYKKK